MGGHFLMALFPVVMVNIIFACLPREYNINNICCPMCDKGSFVKAHCTKELSSSVCVICADTTYMDHPNGLTECFRCRECDGGANLIVKQKCTASSNTICECSAGHFCPTADCDMCQDHKPCQPGEYIKTPGTSGTDTVCWPCPEGYFSDGSNSAECSRWTECSEFGLILDEKGTLTTDSKCKGKRAHYPLAGCLFVFALFPMIYFVRKRKEKPEMKKKTMETETSEFCLSKEESKNPVPESLSAVK